jgi:hypothetical protein
MPINVTDVSEFTSPVVVPADADPANGASVRLFAQQLANRTRRLRDFTGSEEATRLVRMGAHEAATRTGTWVTGSIISSLQATTTTRSSLIFEALAGRPLPWQGTVTQVQVQVHPGNIKEAPEAQIRASLYRVEANPSIVAQVGSTTVVPANTATLQLITITGTVTINGEPTGGNNHRLIVVVESGESVAATNDLVYDVRFSCTTTVR